MANKTGFKIQIEEKDKTHQVLVGKESFIIGRSEAADLFLNVDLVSRKQMSVTFEDQSIWIEDLGSSNGSWLNGRRLEAKKRVQYNPGDRIALGSKQGPFLILAYQQEETRVVQIPKAQEVSQHEQPVKQVANGASISVEAPRPKKRLTLLETTRLATESILRDEGQSRDKILNLQTEAERNLFEHIRNLVGSEAEEIRKASLEEAKSIKARAEAFATEIVKKAQEEADQNLGEAERKLAVMAKDLSEMEKDFQQRLTQLEEQHAECLKNLENIQSQEAEHKNSLENLQERIRIEEDRILREQQELERSQTVLEEEKKAFSLKVEDFQFEERRVRAKLGTELLEANLKRTQILGEVEKVQTEKEHLIPVVSDLKKNKTELEDEVQGLSRQLKRQKEDLEDLKRDYERTLKGLEEARVAQENVLAEISREKEQLHLFKEELQQRDKETQKYFDQSKTVYEETVSRARLESQRLIEEAQRHASELKGALAIELRELEVKKKRLEDDFDLEKERQLSIIQEETRALKADQRHEIEKLEEQKRAFQKELEAKKIQAMEECEKLIQEGEAQAQALKDMAQKYCEESQAKSDDMLEALKLEIQKKRKESAQQLAQVEEKKKVALGELEDIEQQRNKRLQETEEEIQRRLEAADERAKETFERAEAEVQEHRKMQLLVVEQELQKARAEIKDLLLKGDAEAKANKAKQESLLAELKAVEMAKIKEMKIKAEEELAQRKAERARAAAANVYALIASEMYKARSKVLDEDFIKPFSDELKGMVYDSLMDKATADNSKLQAILKTSIDSKGKERIFWRRVMISGGALAFVTLTLYLFPGLVTAPRDALLSALTPNEGPSKSDEFLAQVKEARVQAIYNPPTTQEFKGSYTENVLYTTNFYNLFSDKEFQDKWILELNDFFIQDLDVKDTTIIKFVSLEVALVKELTNLKSQIESSNPEAGINVLRSKESEFNQKLSELFADPNKVPRFYDFQKRFWNKHHGNRQPAKDN